MTYKYLLYGLLLTLLPIATTAQTAPQTIKIWNSRTGKVIELKIDKKLLEIKGSLPKTGPAEDGEIIPTAIMGQEDWQQQPANTFPNSASVYLTMKSTHGTGACSGAMVGKYTVLTAAHCVLDNLSNNDGSLKPASGITAYAGGTGTRIVAQGVEIYAPEAAKRSQGIGQLKSTDYAIIVLNKPLGEQVGYFGVKQPQLRAGDQISVLGFPGKKDHSRPWFSPGKILRLYQGFFEHDADILPGSSGSPTFLRSDNRHIIAVMSYENGNGSGNGSSFPSNHAMLSFVQQYRNSTPEDVSLGNAQEQTPHDNLHDQAYQDQVRNQLNALLRKRNQQRPQQPQTNQSTANKRQLILSGLKAIRSK